MTTEPSERDREMAAELWREFLSSIPPLPIAHVLAAAREEGRQEEREALRTGK
jgi:hypothetical protein